ncbi:MULTISPECIES: ABC transporter ATP-binding protein [Paenibacillus]|uniref:ABC transporter n=2 Tax=Paenibacillus TaxID=44249 RepID=A0A0U2W226_9BACL|nr:MULTISPECIES: ABC transporter ATP-binding protein [Paenibacillus]ALS22596.1 ABC transporter [Paenibacillus naphthalenovorans]NTZ17788.1 ABC transporter ATP-binding protein [Paenibacillus sp. JMULE4]SDH83737.1 branched-chain amino acid transport system ATP-binding protein [Paenibacillus naphthalenovorans]
MSQPILEVNHLSKRFRGLLAVNDLSFHVNKGEILGVIGPNGAGKSTTFNLITGVYSPDTGEVKLNGQNITGLSPNEICKKGLSRTFQVTRPFGDMTVLQNVMVGAFLNTPNPRRAEQQALEMVEFVGLGDKKHAVARTLSIIDQRRLEFARSLATEPALLLLDEALAGLNAMEVEEAIELIWKVKDAGVTLVVIEHVMKVINTISNRVVVLNFGAKLAEGVPKEVMNNSAVIEAYLGKGFAQHA